MANKQDGPATISAAQAESAFDDFYLEQLTREFADDLDKIRSAPDFKNSSVEVLIEALKQGRACFAESDRLNVGRSRLERGSASEG